MIFGRSPNLFLGAITAIVNALVLLGILTLDAQQIAGVDIAAGALIALVAGTPLTDHVGLAKAAAARKARG